MAAMAAKLPDGPGELEIEEIEVVIPLIRECLQAGKSVRFSPKGISMLPMLRQGVDSVVLSPVPEKLRRFDLPLYRRENGKIILHRIVEAGQTYTCMGDNQFTPERGVRADQMIGLVTAFYRGDTLHSVTEPGYRLYCRVWYHTRYLRQFARRCVRWLKRCLK